MFKEIQKLFSLERLETLYLVAARSDAIDARRSRYDATTYQDWFLILPFLSFTTIQFRYQTRQNSLCPAVSKNILYWYFSRYSVLFLFSMKFEFREVDSNKASWKLIDQNGFHSNDDSFRSLVWPRLNEIYVDVSYWTFRVHWSLLDKPLHLSFDSFIHLVKRN